MDIAGTGTGVDDTAASVPIMIDSLVSNTLSKRVQHRVYLQFYVIHFGFEMMCTNLYQKRLLMVLRLSLIHK